MFCESKQNQYFHEYFSDWIKLYKHGAIRPVTYQKYLNTLQRIKELAPCLRISEMNKRSYQALLNKYAETHERQTTMDFHHHLKSVVLDAVDEGLLDTDPTRRVVIKGKPASKQWNKFLSEFELRMLLQHLKLEDKPNWDWFILLVAKTGMRFAEALGLTPCDFDFDNCRIKITKTWDYKSTVGGFAETKNESSKRTVCIDDKLNKQFFALTKSLPINEPIFVNGRVFNSTVNNRLKVLCKVACVPIISIHCLRHTHASLLIYTGVSIASIAKRLGHANITTTQETYLHIIRELENQDKGKILQHLSML